MRAAWRRSSSVTSLRSIQALSIGFKKSHSGLALPSKTQPKHSHGLSLLLHFVCTCAESRLNSGHIFIVLFLGTIEFSVNWLLLSPSFFAHNHPTLFVSLTSTAHTLSIPSSHIPVRFVSPVARQWCDLSSFTVHSIRTFENLPSDSFGGHGLPREAHDISVSAVKEGLRMRTAYSL